MESEIKINKKGDICSPKGFLSGSIFSGIHDARSKYPVWQRIHGKQYAW